MAGAAYNRFHVQATVQPQDAAVANRQGQRPKVGGVGSKRVAACRRSACAACKHAQHVQSLSCLMWASALGTFAQVQLPGPTAEDAADSPSSTASSPGTPNQPQPVHDPAATLHTGVALQRAERRQQPRLRYRVQSFACGKPAVYIF